MRQQKVSKDIQFNIIYDYLYIKMKVKDIETKYNISKGQIYYYLKKFDLGYTRYKCANYKYSEIIKDYLNPNITVKEIMEKYNITNTVIYYSLRKLNLQPSKYQKVNYDEIGNEFKKGKSIQEISKMYKISQEYVKFILCKKGISRRKDFEPTNNQKEIMRLIQEEGLSQAEVGRQLGCSRQRINTIYKKFKGEQIWKTERQ